MKVSDEVVFLEEAFDVLNQRFFESALSKDLLSPFRALPVPMVTLHLMMRGMTVD